MIVNLDSESIMNKPLTHFLHPPRVLREHSLQCNTKKYIGE